MHKLVAEMQLRQNDSDYLHMLMERLEKGPKDEEHAIALDNLHRFTEHYQWIGARLSRHLVRSFCSTRPKLHCWRIFRTLERIGFVNQNAIGAALVARNHWHTRLRWGAQAYLAFVEDAARRKHP